MEQPSNMLVGGMPQNVNSMQRSQPGNALQQIHARVIEGMRAKLPTLPPGWQSTYNPQERAAHVMQIISGLRLLNQDINRTISTAENFEERTIIDSPSKDIYNQRIQAKLQEIRQHRASIAPNLQNGQMNMAMNNNNNGMGMGMPQNNMGNMNMVQNMGMGGMNGLGMNMGMSMNMNQGVDLQNMNMGMLNGQMGGNGMQQQNANFPAHLQRQMQPSPLPQQTQPQQPPNNTLDPAALRNPQMPPQMQNANQQQGANMNQDANVIPPTPAEIGQRAQMMYQSLDESRKMSLRNQVMNTMNDNQKLQMQQAGRDVLFTFLHSKARETLIKERQAQQNGGGMNMGNNAGAGANNMQQGQGGQSSGANIDFNTITGLQANAIKSQESGSEVVPASNNPANFNLGGMNMPPGVNPQLLGNQNGQNNNQNLQHAQMLAMQRQQAQQAQKNRAAQQQAMAQQQAQAQANLRGQPGGLATPNALNGGQVNNSPAMNMSMLNRPMAPPGQTTPSTPHQNQPQNGNQTPMNPAGQLAQHHQNMLNQNQNNQNMLQMSGGGFPGNFQHVLNSIQNPVNREKLMRLGPEAGVRALRSLAERHGGMQAAVAQLSLPTPQSTGMPQQQTANNGMPPNMGNAVPNFSSQPPPNQQGQRLQDSAAFRQMGAQQFQLMKQRAQDAQVYPRTVLETLGIMQVPEAVDTWTKLKQWVHSNQTLPPNMMHRVNVAQNQFFDARPEEARKALEEFARSMAMQKHAQQQQAQQQAQRQQQAQHQQNQQQGQQAQQPPQANRPQSAVAAPNGQAPQAQMVPPAAPMQQQQQQQPPNQAMNMPNANMPPRMPQFPPITDMEIKTVRSKLPNAEQYTDDQIRGLINRNRQGQFAKMRAQALANGQMGNMPPQMGQQPPGPRPPQGQPGPQPVQGQKRPPTSNDDVVEIKNPATAAGPGSNQPPLTQPPPQQQQPPPQPTRGPGNVTMPSAEMFEKMSPVEKQRLAQAAQQQQQQREALRRAQMGLQNPNPNHQQPMQAQQPAQQPPAPMNQGTQPTGDMANMQRQVNLDTMRLKAMFEEVARDTHKGPPRQLDAQQLEEAQAILKKLWPVSAKLSVTFLQALKMPSLGEAKVRSAMKIRAIVQQNAVDETGKIKDHLGVSLEELRKMESFVLQYMGILQAFKQKQLQLQAQARAQMQANSGMPHPQQPQPQQQAQAQPATKQPQPPPQQQQQQAPPLDRKPSQTGHGRKASASNRAPPAPTDNKTFDWNTLGAPSPHGIPKYEASRNELTPDKLKFPPAKKRKTGGQSESQSSTPAAQTGTPAANAASPGMPATKAASPEQLRKMQQSQMKAAEAAKPKFRCEDPTCEKAIHGLESEEALARHREEEHKPVEDPFRFFMDEVEILANAEEKKAVDAAEKAAVGKATAKSGKATPAMPTPGGKIAGKPTTAAAATAGKKAGPAPPEAVPEPPALSPTFMDTLAAKIDFDLPAPQHPTDTLTLPDAPRPDSSTDPFNLSLPPGSPFDNDWSQFRGVTDWGLGDTYNALANASSDSESEPQLTPDSQSSRDSDVSRSARLRINLGSWDPFGSGDTGVPVSWVAREGEGKEGDGVGEMEWETGEIDLDAFFEGGEEGLVGW